MPKSGEYVPRLSVELTGEQYTALYHLIPRGQQRAVFSAIVDDLISILETNRELALAVLISRAAPAREIIPVMKQATEGTENVRPGRPSDKKRE